MLRPKGTAVQRQQMMRLCRDDLAHGKEPRLRRKAGYLLMHPVHDTDDMREMHRLTSNYNDSPVSGPCREKSPGRPRTAARP